MPIGGIPISALASISAYRPSFGFDAGVLEYFSDARERFLKPGRMIIPSRIDLWCAIPNNLSCFIRGFESKAKQNKGSAFQLPFTRGCSTM